MTRPRSNHPGAPAWLVGVILLWALVVTPLSKGEISSPRFLVRSWQAEDGLPGGVVRSIAQGVEGYLWVATAEGLVRFDGIRFTNVEVDGGDEHSLPLSPRFLFPQTDGSMWVATAQGGLLRWDGRRLATVWKEPPGGGLNTASMQVVSDGAGGTLILHDTRTWRSAGGVPEPVERSPAIDALLRADREAWAKRGRPGVGATSVQIRDHLGRSWMTTASGGLVVSDPSGHSETITFLANETERRILELLEDREGNIWAAGGESGLLQIRERRVEMLTSAHGLATHSAMALLEDRAGALWVGGRTGGIDRVTGSGIEHFPVGPGGMGRPISALCEDGSGTLWVATRDGSIFRFIDGAFRTFPNAQAAPSKITAMVADGRGQVWLGGQQGLARWADGEFTNYGAEQGHAIGSITALAVDAKDVLWLGNSAGALFRMEGDSFQPIAREPGRRRRAISALLPESDGSLWAATLGSGLIYWHQDRVTRFTAEHGLPDTRLTCLLEDGAGHLWFGSLGGILRVRQDELREAASGGTRQPTWLQLDRSDGLLSRECSGGFQPAGWRGRDGRLWFATVSGVASIRPATVRLNEQAPRVVIEEVRANGELSPITQPLLSAGPGRSRLLFRFTALTLAAAEKAKFRVLLEGLDEGWRDIGDQRTAAYEAVPPGRYRFRVMAANGDGVWDHTGAEVPLQVLPNWWETAAFRAGAAACAMLAAVGVGAVIARGRMRRRLARLEVQRAREAERSRIARDLHDDLGASLTEISMLASLAAEEAGPGTASGNPLGEIAGKAQVLVTALDEIVWAVNPRHDTVASFVDYLAASVGESLEIAGIALRLDIPRELPAIPLEAERRHSLFLAVREAVNNAVKHSHATEILLRVRHPEAWIEITVRDNGRGFLPDAEARSTSEGLRNLNSRLASLGGECAIESSAQEGTTVQLRMPLAGPAHA